MWRSRHRRACAVEARRAAYAAYLSARYAAAEATTRGHLLSTAGWRAGASPWRLVTCSRPALSHASPELREWLAGHPLQRYADVTCAEERWAA